MFFPNGKRCSGRDKECEGIECRNWEELLIADTPLDFVASVIRLMSDQESCNRLTLNARNRQFRQMFLQQTSHAL